NGEISKAEFLLAIIVDAYVKRAGPGCFATNGYLGRKLGLTAHGVSQCLRNLDRRGFVVRYWQDGRRHLEAYWSRLLEPKSTTKESPKNPLGAGRPGSCRGSTARATPPGTARATRSSLATQESIRKPK